MPTPNGRLMQNLIFAANYLHSHVLHFYQLAALDFVDVKAILRYSGNDRVLGKLKAWVEEAISRKDVFPAAPFFRGTKPATQRTWMPIDAPSHYAEALEIRRICDKMGAVFGARLPTLRPLSPADAPRPRAWNGFSPIPPASRRLRNSSGTCICRICCA